MATGCKGCAPETETRKVRIITPRNRPEDWVRSAAPGDLFLFGGRDKGGILRLQTDGAFVVLTAKQVWMGRPIPWPFKKGSVSNFRIRGSDLYFFSR